MADGFDEGERGSQGEVEEVMKAFRRLDWVVVPDGRVGQISSVNPFYRLATIQFGADGPFEDHKVSSLRWATREESDEKQGVNPPRFL